MADFCRQCTLDNWGIEGCDYEHFAREPLLPQGHGFEVICEGCGFTFVDNQGNCIAEDCLQHHGKKRGNP